MISLRELTDYLDHYLAVPEFVDACWNGIQVEGKNTVKRIATAVSANLETIELAVLKQVDVLIVHHGLFWNRDAQWGQVDGVKRQKLRRLLENEITLCAYHLPLDAHEEVGNNWCAANELGWQQLAPFGLYNSKFIGVKGRFPAIPVEIFQKQLESYYGHPASVALGGNQKVSSAALISGAAYKELSQAKKEGVDCFITGNFDEPAWSMAFEENIHFFALGHSATEKIGPKALAKKLSGVFQMPCTFLDIYNPF